MPKSQSKSSRMTKSPFNSNFQIKSFSSYLQTGWGYSQPVLMSTKLCLIQGWLCPAWAALKKSGNRADTNAQCELYVQPPSALPRLQRHSTGRAGFHCSEDVPGSSKFPGPSQKAFPEELEIKQNELRCGQPAEQVTQTWNVIRF